MCMYTDIKGFLHSLTNRLSSFAKRFRNTRFFAKHTHTMFIGRWCALSALVLSFFPATVLDVADDDMKVNLRVRIMRATNLPSKDEASKITGAHASCDCYVKVNVANEERFLKPI